MHLDLDCVRRLASDHWHEEVQFSRESKGRACE
jgi:hypothetical protein